MGRAVRHTTRWPLLRLFVGAAQVATAVGGAHAVLTGAPREVLVGWAVAAVLFAAVSVALWGGFWKR